MSDSISTVLARIDEASDKLKQLLGGIEEEALNSKPAENKWSVAEILEHIIKINSSYFPIFEALHQEKLVISWSGKIRFLRTFMGNLILKSVMPEHKKKYTTFPIWTPVKNRHDISIIRDFFNHQEQLKSEITALTPFLGVGKVIYSPANKNIYYNLETALDIISWHELRHVNQIEELLNLKK